MSKTDLPVGTAEGFIEEQDGSDSAAFCQYGIRSADLVLQPSRLSETFIGRKVSIDAGKGVDAGRAGKDRASCREENEIDAQGPEICGFSPAVGSGQKKEGLFFGEAGVIGDDGAVIGEQRDVEKVLGAVFGLGCDGGEGMGDALRFCPFRERVDLKEKFQGGDGGGGGKEIDVGLPRQNCFDPSGFLGMKGKNGIRERSRQRERLSVYLT